MIRACCSESGSNACVFADRLYLYHYRDCLYIAARMAERVYFGIQSLNPIPMNPQLRMQYDVPYWCCTLVLRCLLWPKRT